MHLLHMEHNLKDSRKKPEQQSCASPALKSEQSKVRNKKGYRHYFLRHRGSTCVFITSQHMLWQILFQCVNAHRPRAQYILIDLSSSHGSISSSSKVKRESSHEGLRVSRLRNPSTTKIGSVHSQGKCANCVHSFMP